MCLRELEIKVNNYFGFGLLYSGSRTGGYKNNWLATKKSLKNLRS
jgi:hypothetical protein